MRKGVPAGCLIAILPLFGSATADTSSPPVQVNSCAPMLSSGTQTLFGVPVASTSDGIQIQFTNESSKTADLINFAVDSNGQTFVIRDVGTFSPGIEITHKYRNGAGQAFVLPAFVSPNVTCKVDSVRFTDGAVWRPGQTLSAQSASGNASSGRATIAVSPQGPLNLAINGEAKLFLVQSSAAVAAFSERDACSGIANVTLAASGENSATYSAAPVSRGSCTVTVKEESGAVASIPVNVQ